MDAFFEILKTPLARKIIYILCIALLTYILLKVINKVIEKSSKNSLHIKFIGRIVQSMAVIIGVAEVGMQFEVTKELITTVIASSAFLVVVLGFAAQEALSNILSGILISIFKPFEIGDRLHITDLNITGIVEDISLRHTVLKTFNNSKLLIPNSVMNKSVVENFHFNDARSGNFLDVLISYDSDIKKAREIMTKLIEAHPKVIDMRTDQDKKANKPQVFISVRELGESGIYLRASVWTATVDDNFATCSDLREQIVGEFKKNGVKIPYKTIEIIPMEKEEADH